MAKRKEDELTEFQRFLISQEPGSKLLDDMTSQLRTRDEDGLLSNVVLMNQESANHIIDSTRDRPWWNPPLGYVSIDGKDLHVVYDEEVHHPFVTYMTDMPRFPWKPE